MGWIILLARSSQKNSHDIAEKKQVLENILNSRKDRFYSWSYKDGSVQASIFIKEFFNLSLFSLEVLSSLMSSEKSKEFNKIIKRNSPVVDDFLTVVELPDLKLIEIKGYSYCYNHTEEAGYILWFSDVTVQTKINRFQEKIAKEFVLQDNQFKYAASILSFPIWIRDKDSNLKWVNNAYVKAVEAKDIHDVLKQKKELISAGSKNDIGEDHEKLSSLNDDNFVVERHNIVMGGERRTFDIHNILYKTADDDAIVGYAIDVTEIKLIKTELQQHVKSYSEVLNKLSTAVAIFGSDKSLDYYNIAFLRLWDLPESLLTTKLHYRELLEIMREKRKLPEQTDFPKWKKKQMEAYRAVEPVEEMWHLPDERTLRVVSQPRPLGGLLIFYEDVTDYMKLETSLNTLNAVQEATLNNLYEAVAVFGVDGRLKLCNPGFGAMWKISDDKLQNAPHINEILSLSQDNFLNIYDLEVLKDLVVGGFAKKEILNTQITLTDKRVIDYAAIPLPDGAVLMTYLDVTDHYKVEHALRERNDALEISHKIKTDFLAHMSYELRHPLTSIIGFSEMLEAGYMGALNDKQKEYTGNILKASGDLFSLINDILDLTTLEAGGIKLEISSFDLAGMIQESRVKLTEHIAKKKLSLNVTCPENLKVKGDQKRLQHCFYNLLANAVKFTPEYGKISISVESDDVNYFIMINDNGVGIPSKEMGKIYEKFFVGSNVPKGQGAGLGLSLVRSFIELHGGEIKIKSMLGQGTIVRYNLPINYSEQNGNH